MVVQIVAAALREDLWGSFLGGAFSILPNAERRLIPGAWLLLGEDLGLTRAVGRALGLAPLESLDLQLSLVFGIVLLKGLQLLL